MIFFYVFHTRSEHTSLLKSFISKSGLTNCEIISDDKIKAYVLKKSIFAVSKSGTISLEICKSAIPSIIIYKINFLNYLIIKILIKTKFVNIINIASQKEVIPELLQNKCNAHNIYENVNEFLDKPDKIKNQLKLVKSIIDSFKTKKVSSELASEFINKHL